MSITVLIKIYVKIPRKYHSHDAQSSRGTGEKKRKENYYIKKKEKKKKRKKKSDAFDRQHYAM